MHPRVLAVALALALVAPSRDAAAQLESAPAPTPANVVEITIVGSDDDLARIRDATPASDLGGAEVRWRRAERFDRGALLSRGGADRAVAVRAFVVLSGGRAELFFADRAAERFLVRDVALVNGLDSVGTDAVSQVLALSVNALAVTPEDALTRTQTEKLLAPVPAPQSRAPAPVSVAPAVAKVPVSGRSLVGASAFYAGRVFGGGAPLEHGPGLRVGWITEGPELEGALWASAQYAFPLRYEAESAGVELSSALLRGGVSVLVLPGPGARWRVGAGLAAGADLVSFSPLPGSSEGVLELAGEGQTTVFALGFRGLFSVRLGSHLDASAEVFADVYPTRVSYTLSVNGEEARVLEPWRVRPGLALALTLR